MFLFNLGAPKRVVMDYPSTIGTLTLLSNHLEQVWIKDQGNNSNNKNKNQKEKQLSAQSKYLVYFELHELTSLNSIDNGSPLM